MEVQGGKYSTKYMKRTWKLQHEFADSRINLIRDSTTRRHLYVLTLLKFDIVKISIASFLLVL